MEITPQVLFQWIVWPLGLILAWVVRTTFGRITTLEQQNAAIQITLAKEYVNKTELKEMRALLVDINNKIPKKE
jgi:hypothetical protein